METGDSGSKEEGGIQEGAHIQEAAHALIIQGKAEVRMALATGSNQEKATNPMGQVAKEALIIQAEGEASVREDLDRILIFNLYFLNIL